jgi:hypothetical protein
MHDPLREPQNENQGYRVVEAGFSLESPTDPPAESRPSQQAEHRGRVCRRDDRTEQQGLPQRDAEQPHCSDSGDNGHQHGAADREAQ